MVLSLSALTLFASDLCVGADSFEDLWLTRIKPPPYGGVATQFTDTIAATGSDTIEHFMDDYFATPDAQAVDTHLFNIKVPVDFTGVFNVPADANCGSQDYVPSGATGPPPSLAPAMSA